ncbi:unnamed protein product [Phytomonas sp. EM1]|nr:unnamed protein product [Phytomonas sp. EM1]|eukprot:CCW65031.1 unnamed protein product [Phytomonas sp. isolate EM1]
MLAYTQRMQRVFRVREPLKKAVRRQQQLKLLYKSKSRPAVEAAPQNGHPDPNVGAHPCRSPTHISSAHFFHTPTSTPFVSDSPSACDLGRLVVANRTLQHALLGVPYESKRQRQAADAIQHSPNKSSAVETFLLLAQSTDDGITTPTLRALSTALVRHQARELFGDPQAYHAALSAAVGSEDDRWRAIDAADEHVFALSQCRALGRYAEKGSRFSPSLGLTVEGADDDDVARVAHVLRQGRAGPFPVPTDVLADLAHLDVSWSTALRLWRRAGGPCGAGPPVEMTDRLMALMTGYRSGGIGSRPWQEALRLYERALDSGGAISLTTHTHALDALWRSADSFHRAHYNVAPVERERLWQAVMRVRAKVEDGCCCGRLRIAGPEGCAYMEGLIKASGAAGRWDVAIGLLSDMERTSGETSYRLLIPTPEAYAFAMAACNREGHAAHSEALWSMFELHYTLRSLHSEALLVYLQSLRCVVTLTTTVGEKVERLVQDGAGLDRPCTVACLQLLASQHVRTATRKSALAAELFHYYDSNAWLQQPLARRMELQSVFRSCYLVATSDASSDLMKRLKDHLTLTFGTDAPELEWFEDTKIYALHTTLDWKDALETYARLVERRPRHREKFLPIPVRQARHMLVQALLRCCHIAAHCGSGQDDRDCNLSSSFMLLEEDAQEKAREELFAIASRGVFEVRRLYAEDECNVPHEMLSELLLLEANYSPTRTQRNSGGVQAIHQLALGPAARITSNLIDQISEILSLSEAHLTSFLLDGHPMARDTALSAADAKRGKWQSTPLLERAYR